MAIDRTKIVLSVQYDGQVLLNLGDLDNNLMRMHDANFVVVEREWEGTPTLVVHKASDPEVGEPDEIVDCAGMLAYAAEYQKRAYATNAANELHRKEIERSELKSTLARLEKEIARCKSQVI